MTKMFDLKMIIHFFFFFNFSLSLSCSNFTPHNRYIQYMTIKLRLIHRKKPYVKYFFSDPNSICSTFLKHLIDFCDVRTEKHKIKTLNYYILCGCVSSQVDLVDVYTFDHSTYRRNILFHLISFSHLYLRTKPNWSE